MKLVQDEVFDLFAAELPTPPSAVKFSPTPRFPPFWILSSASSQPLYFLWGSALVPSFFCLRTFSLSGVVHSWGFRH